jgi:uncharacterized repeat protein (TIGR03803 family)
LHKFAGTPDGASPSGRLISDSAGNLYGTTINGGVANKGTVFELSPPSGSGTSWSESVLYSFQGGSNDGYGPWGGLVFDASGNLYGTTEFGGSRDGAGFGTVFELSPPSVAGGAWTETVLYSFKGGKDGVSPVGDTLIFDAAGNLYGTTDEGGIYSDGPYSGTAFELSPPAISGGAWSETILHSFGHGTDGNNVIGKLTFDPQGNLYGTTEYGGTQNQGTVFRLKPVAGGKWAEQLLYSFTNGTDGGLPRGGVTLGKTDVLYGGTVSGGTYNQGVVFQLSPQPGGGWIETTLYSFTDGTDGASPLDGVSLGKTGTLYGTAYYSNVGAGAAFELTPSTGGGWTDTTLHDFTGPDGDEPWGALLIGKNGTLFGTTLYGGNQNNGVVFEIKP